MIYKQDYYGYVYKWTNVTTGLQYIGSHYGSVNDTYIGSGKDFIIAYKSVPDEFTMVVLEYVTENSKKLVLEIEKKWLDTVLSIKDNPQYYNLNNDAVGGFGYITNAHIAQRANTLKARHAINGLSAAEQESYKRKIQSRLNRIATCGFTDKEKDQYSRYGYQIQITLPSGEIKIYGSCGQATRELGIDVQYGLAVCAKKIDFKGHLIVKLRDPIVDCR